MRFSRARKSNGSRRIFARALISLMLVVAVTPTTLMVSSPAVSATASPFSGVLLFHDSFSGVKGSLPTAGAWTDYSYCSYGGNAAFGQIGCGNDETLDGAGSLSLPATPTTGSGVRVASKYSYEYGVFSAWIKAPAQDGYWPAFWTVNSPYTQTSLPVAGEADAYEEYTHWPTQSWATEHNWTNDGTSPTGSGTLCPATPDGGPDLSAAFHKYSVAIAPDSVTFYIDSKQCGPVTTPATNPGNEWGFGPSVTGKNWMILDLAIGGAGNQQPTPTADAAMLVARVEIRKLP